MTSTVILDNALTGDSAASASVADFSATTTATDLTVITDPGTDAVVPVTADPVANPVQTTWPSWAHFTVTVNGTGQVSARVALLGCNDGRSWVGFNEITLSGQAPVSQTIDSNAPYAYYTAQTLYVSTGATVTVTATA